MRAWVVAFVIVGVGLVVRLEDIIKAFKECPECPECLELPPLPSQEPTKGEIWWDEGEEQFYVYRGWVKLVEEEEK